MERPHLDTLLDETVTLHFPNGDWTTGPLKWTESREPVVNGWLVNVAGRFFSVGNKVYD